MEQMNLDGFSAGELAAMSTLYTNAINARLTPTAGQPLAAEAYSIKGRDVSLTPLKELLEMLANIKNAIAKKTAEPDGLGIALATISDPDGSPAGGSAYPWPYAR